MAGLRALPPLLRACHPEPAAGVTVGATALAAATGRGGWGIAAVAGTVAASQLATGWHNDWLDVDRDARAGRRDKPIAAGEVSRRTVGLAAVVATGLTVPLAFASGAPAATVAALGLLAALAYNWPLRSTAVSVVPYAVAFAALPAFVILGAPGAPAPPWWLLVAGATLGAGAHFANVLPDLEHDLRTGVRGLPHRVGAGWSAALAGLLLAVASAVLVFGPPGPAPPLALAGIGAALLVLAAGGLAQRRRPASRAAFRAVIVAALIDVALLLAAGTVV